MSKRTFLFITANENEYLAFRAKDRFIPGGERHFGKGIVCNYGRFGNYDNVWHHHLSEQGPGSQSIIHDTVNFIKPDVVILIGIACGNKYKKGDNRQKYGDILVSQMIIDHSTRKVDDTGKTIHRGAIFTCPEVLFRKFFACRLPYIAEHIGIGIHCGQIATDTIKTDHPETTKEIFSIHDNTPVGYEMEGFFAVRACRNENMVFLVKGISDFGDGIQHRKNEKQKKAAKNAVDFCHYVFSKGKFDGIPKRVYEMPIELENNLPDRNKYFTGREKELASLEKLFDKNQKIDVVSICQTVSGLGGIGKTALAVEYAYRNSKNYKSAIWFLVAESTTTLYNGFVEFANRFKIILPPKFKLEDLQFAIKNWLSENEGWLFIFDNLETNDKIIQPYLPTNINGHFIITTRNTHINIGKPLDLSVFALDEAIDFLKRRFSNDDECKMENYKFDDFSEKAIELAKRLGLLPLALEQAAAYVCTVRKTITDYLKQLDDVGLEPFKNENGYSTPTNYKSIVTATWKISFSKLREEERQLFNLCAYMAPNKIPLSFFTEMRHKLPEELNGLKKALEKDGGAELATELRHYSLASGDAYYIDIHRLVQEVVRESHEVSSLEH